MEKTFVLNERYVELLLENAEYARNKRGQTNTPEYK